MCLILFSYLQSKEYTLILAANRDEFYDRPTMPARPWDEVDGIVAGKDLKAGGTWMGIHDSGRFGMVTNYRDPSTEKMRTLSRGQLVVDYLKNERSPEMYLAKLHQEDADYNGYNVLLGDSQSLWSYSNRASVIKKLQPGLYGLSNHLLETPWPKVVRGKALFESVINKSALDIEALFHILQDDQKAPDHALPHTGVPVAWERTLSSMFIRSEGYGTRCSSVMLVKQNGVMEFYERTYPTDGSVPATVHYAL